MKTRGGTILLPERAEKDEEAETLSAKRGQLKIPTLETRCHKRVYKGGSGTAEREEEDGILQHANQRS